jgi:RNA recognition motif-containing protein
MAETSKQKSTVFVGGLDNQVNAQILHDAFIPFGEIVDVSLPKPEQYANASISQKPNANFILRASNRDPHRGFGYVEFSLAEDAREAIDNMDQAELYGRVIKVNQAKPQKNADEGLGSRTAVWEQVSLEDVVEGRSLEQELTTVQEGYAAKFNVNDEDRLDSEELNGKPEDPMQGLEGLDEAGPRMQ